eukprot:358752-Chlamydomonas_euryale.AAC.6
MACLLPAVLFQMAKPRVKDPNLLQSRNAYPFFKAKPFPDKQQKARCVRGACWCAFLDTGDELVPDMN